jgi:CheY-like chemotaxis protein
MTRILLVEDNSADIRFVREALAEISDVELDVVRDGSEVQSFLDEKEELPALVLLDLNLPGCRGDEVLRRMRESPRTTSLPVVVMSSSRAPQDVRDCYREHANTYIVKPLEFDDYCRAMQSIQHYWLDIATLPEIN